MRPTATSPCAVTFAPSAMSAVVFSVMTRTTTPGVTLRSPEMDTAPAVARNDTALPEATRTDPSGWPEPVLGLAATMTAPESMKARVVSLITPTAPLMLIATLSEAPASIPTPSMSS